MKTGEFTKQVEELGYKVKRYTTFTGDNLYISNDKEEIIAIVSLQHFVTSSCFYYENEENKSKLFNLLVEYEKTPIEKK